jgi:hypothetical protein
MPTQLQARVRKAILLIAGVIESEGIFGDGTAFWVNGKQVGHFRDDRTLELRLTRRGISAQRARFKQDARVELRRSTSDWVRLHFRTSRDVDFVAELAEQAAEAHRPRPGVAPMPPPLGRELERRRRFH